MATNPKWNQVKQSMVALSLSGELFVKFGNRLINGSRSVLEAKELREEHLDDLAELANELGRRYRRVDQVVGQSRKLAHGRTIAEDPFRCPSPPAGSEEAA